MSRRATCGPTQARGCVEYAHEQLILAEIGHPWQRHHGAHPQVGSTQLGRDQDRVIARVGGQQREMPAAEPPASTIPIGVDAQLGGLSPHPSDRAQGIGDHPGHISLREQPVGHVHHHVPPCSQVTEQRPSPHFLVQHVRALPCT